MACVFQYVIFFSVAVTIRIPLFDVERTTSEQLFEWIDRRVNFTRLENPWFVVRSLEQFFFVFFSSSSSFRSMRKMS